MFCLGTAATSISNLSNVSNEPKSNATTFSGFFSTVVSPSSCSTTTSSASSSGSFSVASLSLVPPHAASVRTKTDINISVKNFLIFYLFPIFSSIHKSFDYRFVVYLYPYHKCLLTHIHQCHRMFYDILQVHHVLMRQFDLNNMTHN